jgi:serine kinase of HPr protein (carbohydrate metabolism regulator)
VKAAGKVPVPRKWDGKHLDHTQEVDIRSEVLLIGGRSGVGKSSIAFELHAQQLVAAMGDEPRVVAVLLTATVETAQARLGRRSAGDRCSRAHQAQ